ncbi:hypothetical protein ILUMI_06115 [Ignelater luminosus]|uniref:Uncharacterized protein n=1 Tax=Ignelater luminosus TaxID=2038154 RepID=A0A8K0D9W1_IGNLU|nr:hypothetical protein ILUMI_06115 [Ignelater luminosus]
MGIMGACRCTLKRHRRVAEDYIDNSMKNKVDTAKEIVQSVQSNSIVKASSENLTMNITTPSLNIKNCSNFTTNMHNPNLLNKQD